MSTDGRITGWGWLVFAGFALLLCAIGYGVVRLSRRPQTPGDGAFGDRVEIELWRAKAGWWAIFFFAVLFAATRWVMRFGTAGAWVTFAMAVALAALTFNHAKRAVVDRTALILDRDGLQDLRRDLQVPWRDVQEVHVRTRQGSFDEYHELVVHLADGPPLKLPLDDLAMSWQDVARVVREFSGRAATDCGLR